MTEVEKRKVSDILRFAHSGAIKAVSNAAEVRRFFNKSVLNTFNGWNERQYSPAPVHFRMTDDGLFISRAGEGGFFKAWPSDFWSNLPSLQPLLKSEAA